VPSSDKIPPASTLFVSTASLRHRLDWFNKLRWGALAVVSLAVIVVDTVVAQTLPMPPILVTVGMLGLLNALYVWRNRRVAPVSITDELRLVKLQMLGDLVALTVLLNLTGGVENPLLFVYMVHVIIGALLFKGRDIYLVAAVAIALFTAEVLGEYWGLLPHHHLLGASAMTHELPYILVTLSSFWLVLLVSAYMGAAIMKHNRAIRDDLVERQRQLMAADEAKMEFFRFVTHEVKSPVNTAQSAVELAVDLGGDGLPPRVRDMLDRAVARLEQATEIVKDLADFTRGGLNRAEQRTDVDLSALVTETVDQHREAAARTDQAWDLELPATPVHMVTDRGMVGKIVTNLVSNAVRYNRAGGRLRVSLEDHPESVAFQVADEGIGIAPEDQERIFEEFYRTAAAQKQTTLGTGLGLPIVRRFVTGLGGAVQVTSRPGEGATFRVVLPRGGKGGGP
jgi:signal transduction histidine kinase